MGQEAATSLHMVPRGDRWLKGTEEAAARGSNQGLKHGGHVHVGAHEATQALHAVQTEREFAPGDGSSCCSAAMRGVAAARVGYGSSCRFPTKTGAAVQDPITRSFSMAAQEPITASTKSCRPRRLLLLAARGRALPNEAMTVAVMSLTVVLAR